MVRAEYRRSLESQHGVLLTLWAVFVGAIPVYLWIAETVLSGRQLAIAPLVAETVRLVVWLLAFFNLGTLFWWKRRFLTKEAILGGAKQYKVLQALQAHKGETEERAAALVSSYVTAKVVVFAMAEAMAVYGFAMVLVGQYFFGQYLLSAAAVALLALNFPSRAFLSELLSEAENESKTGGRITPAVERSGP